MPGTTTTDNDTLKEVFGMWTGISPVFTVEQLPDDKWNYNLMWRGHKMGLVTEGIDGMVAFTCTRQVDPRKFRVNNVLTIGDSYAGSRDFCTYVGKMAMLEGLVRQWPTVLPDAAGNLRLLIGEAEYGLIDIASTELKYRQVTSTDGKGHGTWGYTDLESLAAYTNRITKGVDTIDERKVEKELDSLLEL